MATDPPRGHEAIAASLLSAERAVALTGLRLGVPEERDVTHAHGEWARRASLEALLTDPAAFWDFALPAAEEIARRRPGPGHVALARLQNAGLLSALVTQAVDRLHTVAGSTDVVEVHGNVLGARCTRCGELYGLPEVRRLVGESPDGVPRCTTADCGFPIRPAGTLWGEPLLEHAVRRAWDLATEADCFIVVDCELRTVPLSLLPSVPLTRNVPLVMIGETPTQYDRYAHVLVREPSATVLSALVDLLVPR